MPIRVTTEQAQPVFGVVLPPLLERIEDGGDPAAALADAFCEGMRFAAAEIVAFSRRRRLARRRSLARARERNRVFRTQRGRVARVEIALTQGSSPAS
jgi:hypothetical protein